MLRAMIKVWAEGSEADFISISMPHRERSEPQRQAREVRLTVCPELANHHDTPHRQKELLLSKSASWY